MYVRCVKISAFKTMFMFTGTLLLLSYWSVIGVMSIINLNTLSNPAELEKSLAQSHVCNVNYEDKRLHIDHSQELKTIYYVTPTYPRPEQIPELTRLSHTLMHVPQLHWIVADDQMQCSDEVLDVLQRSGLPFTHLASPKPAKFKGNNIPRGVANRRAALSWLRLHTNSGILYFGDDDNTLDLRLFNEIRKTQKVSMFPVGLIGEYGVSSPIAKNGKVVGFFDPWPAYRTFPVDMAGFAVNLKHLTPTADMPFIAGYEEDKFLLSLGITPDDIEPLADNCSKILVWHTRTMKHKKSTLRADFNKLKTTSDSPSFVALLHKLSKMGITDFHPKVGRAMAITRLNEHTSAKGLP